MFLNIVKILEWTKLKAVVDDELKEAKMMFSVYDGVQNIVGKGENAGCQYFFPFLQCFHKLFIELLTLSQANPVFYVSAVQVF